MRTVIVEITTEEKKALVSKFYALLKQKIEYYNKYPENFGDKSIEELMPYWHNSCYAETMFSQIEKDGLAVIEQHPEIDPDINDYFGDCFDIEVNKDIDPAVLQKKEQEERERFYREGACYHTLSIKGTPLSVNADIDTVGGFIGNDFYGSGIEHDFYVAALEIVQQDLPDYLPSLEELLHPKSN